MTIHDKNHRSSNDPSARHEPLIRAIEPAARIRETTDAYAGLINGVAAMAQAHREGDDSYAHLTQVAAAKPVWQCMAILTSWLRQPIFEKQGSQITQANARPALSAQG